MFSLVHWAICILSDDYKTMIMRAGARVENVVDQKVIGLRTFRGHVLNLPLMKFNLVM